MSHIMSWCGFLGAWLLVAGPLDQAVRELEDQEFEHEAVQRAAEQVGEPEQISGWWMLLPPVWWALRRRREHKYRHEVGQAMEDEQLGAFFEYRDIAGAWIYVAGGAALIGVEATWSLRESYEWPEWTWAMLVLLMLVVCGAIATYRRHRRHRRMKLANAAAARSAPGGASEDRPIAD